MKERPGWIRVIEGGKTDLHAHEVRQQDELKDALTQAIERTPADWQSHVEQELLDLYRRHMLLWNDEQLTHHLTQPELWEDATFARALIEVAKGKTLVPITQETSL